MAATLRLATLAVLGVVFCAAAVADIVVGTKREDVLAELGKAKSAQRGTHEILTFPKGIRIELENGLVTDIKGYVPAAAAPATPAEKTPTPNAAAPAPAKTSPKNPAGMDDYNPPIAANALGDQVAKMDTAWGSAPPNPLNQKPLPALELAIALVMRFGLTVLALRVAFKYWEMDAFWTGTFAIAAIDAALHGVLEALGPMSGGFTTMGGVENAVPAFVMIFTVRHFCFNKRIPNAVLTAGAVKTMVMLFNIFVSIALLNALFGGHRPH